MVTCILNTAFHSLLSHSMARKGQKDMSCSFVIMRTFAVILERWTKYMHHGSIWANVGHG